MKKLDKLTHEEARMATAQNLKATHTVDDRVRGVDTKMDSVGGEVKEVNDKVTVVNDRVTLVNDNVAILIEGTQTVFSC